VDALIGDSSKAKRVLNWSAKTNWDKVAEIMVLSDLEHISNIKR